MLMLKREILPPRNETLAKILLVVLHSILKSSNNDNRKNKKERRNRKLNLNRLKRTERKRYKKKLPNLKKKRRRKMNPGDSKGKQESRRDKTRKKLRRNEKKKKLTLDLITGELKALLRLGILQNPKCHPQQSRIQERKKGRSMGAELDVVKIVDSSQRVNGVEILDLEAEILNPEEENEVDEVGTLKVKENTMEEDQTSPQRHNQNRFLLKMEVILFKPQITL